MANFFDPNQVLRDNITTLTTLDKSLYPTLTTHFKKTKCLACLLRIIEDFLSKNHPGHTAKDGKHWYYVAGRYLITLHGGSKSTWHTHMKFLIYIGLMECIRPSEETTAPSIHHSWKIAKEKKRRPIMWYHIPLYTPDLLQEAERKAKEYKDSNVSTSHINKASLIIAGGQRAANKAYADARKITRLQSFIMQEITKTIQALISTKGYLRKDDVFNTVWATLYTQYHSHKKPFPMPSTWKETSEKIEKVWDSVHNKLLSDANAVYRRPTKAEKALYNLSDDRWIITRRNDHE